VSKYGNQKTLVDGHLFASKAEAYRYQDLKLLLKAGHISNLELQPKFELCPKQKGERAVHYIGDFRYIEDGKVVVEDVKGFRTKEYLIKRRFFKYQNPDIDFREVVV